MIPKYRVWDKATKSICNVGALYFSRYCELEAISVHLHDGWVVRRSLSKVVLLPSTGVKDKNGVEVFGGHIVKVTEAGGDSYITDVYWGGEDGYPAFDLNMEYIPSTWYYESNVLSAVVNNPENETMEVIGNIYENFDLLEAV